MTPLKLTFTYLVCALITLFTACVIIQVFRHEIAVPDYDYFKWFTYIVCGGAGGFVADFFSNGKCVVMPVKHENRWHLGAIGGVIMGSICGVIGDSRPINAFFWGAGAMTILPYLISRVPSTLTSCFQGISNDQLPNNSEPRQDQGNTAGDKPSCPGCNN